MIFWLPIILSYRNGFNSTWINNTELMLKNIEKCKRIQTKKGFHISILLSMRWLIIVPAYELLLHIHTNVRNQLVCHLYNSCCLSKLHAKLTLQWLQVSSRLQHNVRMYHHHHLVYLHPLLSAAAIQRR